MPDFHNETYTIDMIISKILTDDRQYDISKLVAAYEYAAQCHEGQTRSSGEPYIIHPVTVAYILLDLGMDTDTLCAALLHDVVEDTAATREDVQKRFGHDVAMLVEGVTKLAKVPTFTKEQQQAENVMKILLAMSPDIRVMILHLIQKICQPLPLLQQKPLQRRVTACQQNRTVCIRNTQRVRPVISVSLCNRIDTNLITVVLFLLCGIFLLLHVQNRQSQYGIGFIVLLCHDLRKKRKTRVPKVSAQLSRLCMGR